MRINAAPVSAVIPCWRCADTISRAMDSIASQSLRPAEVILVDDASGDGTLAELYRLAGQYPPGWVQVIALETNGGPGAARNAGWEYAKQPWIAFLDADDAWHPRKVELQMSWLEQHPDAAMCGHGTALLSTPTIYPDAPARPRGWRVGFLNMVIANRFPTRSVMLRRDLPFRFQDWFHSEDFHLWLLLILSNYSCYRLEGLLAFSFREDASDGGLSGNLWRHERQELLVWRTLYREGKISWAYWFVASTWSLIKFVRRLMLNRKAKGLWN